jgi:4-hydroxybenzoate polyprenyltransferase
MGAASKNISILFRALRVYQWTKNLLVLAPLIFAKQVADVWQDVRSLEALIAFCMASSATYLLNDIMDIEKDRAHPKKCNRPLPSGAMKIPTAWFLGIALLVGSLVLGWFIRPQFLAALLFYVGLTISYSLLLKHIIIIDVLAVALGFVVRAMAGAVAINVVFSNWLVVCTLFLALFLSLSKRRNEISLMEGEAHTHRGVLFHYTIPYLDQLILIVAGGAIITYTIYTCSPEVVVRLGTDKLYMTLPFVVYGLFRYLFLVHAKTDGGDPSSTLITDWPLGLTVVLWALTCGAIIYFQ